MSIQLRRYQNPKDADSLSSLGLDQGQPAILDMTSGTEQYDNTLVATNASDEFGRYLSSQAVGGDSGYYCLESIPPDVYLDNGDSLSYAVIGNFDTAAGISVSSSGAYNPDEDGSASCGYGIAQKGSQVYLGITGKFSALGLFLAISSPIVSYAKEASNISRLVIPGLPKPKSSASGYLTLLLMQSTGASDSTISFARNLVNIAITVDTDGDITFSSKTIPSSWYCPGSTSIIDGVIFTPVITKNPLDIDPSSYSTLSDLTSALIDQINLIGRTNWTSIEDVCISYECETGSYGDSGIPINTEYSVEVPYCNVKYLPETFPTDWSKIRNKPTWVSDYGRREVSLPPTWLTETWYEEGTWSSELSDCTLTTNSCWYRKEGPVVFIGAYLRIGTDSHSSGYYIVSGLPFSPSAIMGVSTLVQANLYVSTTSESNTGSGNQNHFCRTMTGAGIQLTYSKTNEPDTDFSGQPIYISGWYLTSDS